MTDVPERLGAALADRYRLERELGAGGMATVYLAEDLKHDRQVAIKVLKPELAAVIGGERFVTEIKTTAALQHPHILPLFDSGAADGFLYYVMPFVDGESLRDRLDRERQLSVEESVKIAAAVASALQYAHERGIVHRDIKPANILLHAGEPVVADFGIALAISAAGGGRLTETGMSVGTPHYMSPEQASADRDVSARSDIYALGCVLYEMLAGDPPHTGPTAQAVLMRILTEDPRDVAEVRRAVPSHVRDALSKALEKLPADRFENADEFKRALTESSFTYRPRPRPQGPVRRYAEEDPKGWGRDNRTRALVGVSLLLAAALGGTAFQTSRPGTVDAPPPHRYAIVDSLRSDINLDISHNGDVAYVATVDGRQHLRLRRAIDTRSIESPNTTGSTFVSFSPAGDWLAFSVNQRELKKVQLSTGTAVTLVAEGPGPFLGFPHWLDDGTILFSAASGVYRVPDVGGEPELISEGASSFFPRLLPDGRTLLFTAMPQGNPSSARVVARDLVTGDTLTIVESGGNAVWSPTGHILYGHPSGSIFALPFDLRKRTVTGAPVPVLENVFTVGAVSIFSLSPTGSLVYLGGGGTLIDLAAFEFAWLDTEGNTTAIPIEPTDHADARISPDGRQIAYTRDGYIHLFDLVRETNQRLTFEGQAYHDPVWSPDGRRIAFTASRDGSTSDIYVKNIDGRSAAERVVESDLQDYSSAWLEDGTIVYFSREAVGAPTSIFMTRLGGDEGPIPLLQREWDETAPRVSPDGRMLAYSSDDTGARHLFVREFPGMGGRWQVSARPVQGQLVWSRESDAIFYQDEASGRLIRAELGFEPTFQVLARHDLSDQMVGNLRDIHPDGRRLFITRPVGVGAFEDLDQELLVVANWLTELRSRLGRRN
jgi:eukaryotic-like serine/threonine-protein kinase